MDFIELLVRVVVHWPRVLDLFFTDPQNNFVTVKIHLVIFFIKFILKVFALKQKKTYRMYIRCDWAINNYCEISDDGDLEMRFYWRRTEMYYMKNIHACIPKLLTVNREKKINKTPRCIVYAWVTILWSAIGLSVLYK